jgi:hypothetical protein
MHDIIDNNQQKYNSTRLDVHKNTIQEIRNHIFRKLFSNKGNAKHDFLQSNIIVNTLESTSFNGF